MYRSLLHHANCIWDVKVPHTTGDGKNPGQLPPRSFVTCSEDNTVRVWTFDRNKSYYDKRPAGWAHPHSREMMKSFKSSNSGPFNPRGYDAHLELPLPLPSTQSNSRNRRRQRQPVGPSVRCIALHPAGCTYNMCGHGKECVSITMSAQCSTAITHDPVALQGIMSLAGAVMAKWPSMIFPGNARKYARKSRTMPRLLALSSFFESAFAYAVGAFA